MNKEDLIEKLLWDIESLIDAKIEESISTSKAR